jgi:hypothetical protein
MDRLPHYYRLSLYFAGDFLRKVGHFGTLPGPGTSSASARPLLLFYDMAINFIKSAGISFAALGLRRIVSDSQCGLSAAIGGRVPAADGAPLIDQAAQNRGCTRLPTRDALGLAGSGVRRH